MERETNRFLHHTQPQIVLPWIMSSLFSFPETWDLCAESNKATDYVNNSQGTRGITECSRVMFIRTAPKNRKRKCVKRQCAVTRHRIPKNCWRLRNRRQPRPAGPEPGVWVRTAGTLHSTVGPPRMGL